MCSSQLRRGLQNLLESLEAAMLERLRDKQPTVRAYAARVLTRLYQEPDEVQIALWLHISSAVNASPAPLRVMRCRGCSLARRVACCSSVTSCGHPCLESEAARPQVQGLSPALAHTCCLAHSPRQALSRQDAVLPQAVCALRPSSGSNAMVLPA